jgi:carboxylesterase type B
VIFANPAIVHDSQFVSEIRSWLPTAAESVVSYLATILYPPIFDGSQGYETMLSRVALILGEMAISCNANFLAQAFSASGSRAYLFSVPPGVHGTDIDYAFYAGNPSPGVINDTTAFIVQDYFTQFAITGDPNIPGLTPNFPLYGSNSTLLNINASFISPMSDPVANSRCAWWQDAVYV